MRLLAERTLDDLLQQQSRSGRLWTTVAIARAQGLLHPDHADHHFECSLAAARQLGAPFEWARTSLCWALANRDRRPSQARADATAAMDAFLALGAAPWASKCEAVLGLRSAGRRGSVTIAAQLTAAELRVALAVGGGASSREAAEQLYLSVRTVEFHLNNIYRRLGVRSRTELALLVERERNPSV